MIDTSIGEYERTFLAMLVHKPSIIDSLDVQDFLFFTDANAAIFDAIVEARKGGTKPDLLMISDALRRQGNDKYLPILAGQAAPLSTANANYYRDKLAEYARKRELKRTIETMREAIEDVSVSADELADKALESISDAMRKTALRTSPTISSLLQPYIDSLNRRVMEYRNHTSVLMGTGFSTLDDLMGAMMPSELVVVAARPSCGKSVFAQMCATHISAKLDIPSAFFSLEMDNDNIIDRMMAVKNVGTVREIREGRLSDDALRTALGACEEYRNAPLALYDSVYSTAQLHSYVRREVFNRGVKFVVVDYLGLLAGLSGDGSRARWEKVGEESRYLKLLAKELKITIMLLVQLNRRAEDEEPTLGMLRDSGSIEQDADKILFLWSREEQDVVSFIRQVLVKIGKNRNGAIGQVPLMFDGAHTRMYVEAAHNEAPVEFAGVGTKWSELE